MPPLPTVLRALAAVFVCLVVFSFLMGVSAMDISAKHRMQRHVVAEPFDAGDIVALSPDGQSLGGLLCALDLPEASRSDSGVSARYYNLFDEMQDDFFAFAHGALRLVGLSRATAGPGAAALGGLPFTGEVSRVVGRIETRVPGACWCDIGRAVLERRQKACVVEKSLVRTTLEETAAGRFETRTTMGISFRPDAIWIADPAALAPLCPGLNVAAVAPPEQSCGGSSGFSFDVRARGLVGVIREAPLD
ncbi:hypothetical protein [Roseivivax jejudonensis]|uniref:hypothetical protein n=1 Tax=Roseivivax jejudonensis TaxID=1529041 RepID=UPI000A26CA5C|nr:hypothetical protein [Roseivivax jejudonensis]